MALVKSPLTIRNLIISVHKHQIKDAPDEEAPLHSIALLFVILSSSTPKNMVNNFDVILNWTI